MQRPIWTITPTIERETVWHGEIFHLAKEDRFWYLHRGPSSTTAHSNAQNAIAHLDTTVGASADLAALFLNGWTGPVLTADGTAYTHRDGTRREPADLIAELAAAPDYTPTRGEACVERALDSHLRECDATRVADTCHVRDALTIARRAELLTLMEQVVDTHHTVRWHKPAQAGQVVVHFADTEDPRIAGGIGYDLHHRPDRSPWRVGAAWISSTATGHRATGHRDRVSVPTAAQLAEEITRQVDRVRAAVTATA